MRLALEPGFAAGIEALHFGAQGVMAGAYDIVIAGGVEVMTRTPMGASVVRDLGFPFGPRVMQRYAERGLVDKPSAGGWLPDDRARHMPGYALFPRSKTGKHSSGGVIRYTTG